ncbi:MAG: hypothetical protein AAFX54_17830 [Pseudomonadota bacterium]
MTTDEAISLGIIIGGPLLSIAGVFFAVAISANQHINGAVKGVAWALSPIAGLVAGSRLAAEYVPGLGEWGVALMFGHGFFYTWIAAAVVGHDDTKDNAGKLFKWAAPIIRKIRAQQRQSSKTVKSDELATYLDRQIRNGE